MYKYRNCLNFGDNTYIDKSKSSNEMFEGYFFYVIFSHNSSICYRKKNICFVFQIKEDQQNDDNSVDNKNEEELAPVLKESEESRDNQEERKCYSSMGVFIEISYKI